MEYKITKEKLGNDWLYSTLVALNKCMAEHGLPLYVVGARARDVAMKLMKGDEGTEECAVGGGVMAVAGKTNDVSRGTTDFTD